MEYSNATNLNQQSPTETNDTHRQLNSKRVIGVNSVVVSERELSVAEPVIKSDFNTARVEYLPSKPESPIITKVEPTLPSPKIVKQESIIT